MTSAIDSDLLSGLPSAGSNIGGALKNVAPGAGSMILTLGVATGIAKIPGYIAKGISKRDKQTKLPKYGFKLPKYKLPKYKY